MAQLVITPTFSDILTTLRSFLLGALPQGTIVVRGQVNRVPEPPQQNFVVMTPIRIPRIRTNVDNEVDCLFTASIAGTVMTVTDISLGVIAPPAQLFSSDLVGGTATVVSQISGVNGSIGTYRINTPQTMLSTLVSAGGSMLEQAGEFVIQLDVHGPSSTENVQIISTLFRDSYATDVFEALDPRIAPLYADEPKQIPFINAENQYEDRWVVEAHLQVNQIVTIAQQFMDDLVVDLVDVDATFPPS